jgi:S1-C subfamily serine protease
MLNEIDANSPISTKWLLDSVGETARNVIQSVFMVICKKTRVKGTGFLHRSGLVITNYHVVKGVGSGDIVAISSTNQQISFSKILADQNRDLAILKPDQDLKGGLEIDFGRVIAPGVQVSTWGFPLGYNGPSPLLTVGYVSGFVNRNGTKNIVVNGAFNPGNSGGPLFISGDNKIIGVVVSKHAPITSYVQSAMNALASNPSGFVYTGTDENGTPIRLSEAQVVHKVLEYFRSMTQVVIGEAIDKSELITFLKNVGTEP